MKRNLALFCVCVLILTVTVISCGEDGSNDTTIKYPESVYDKAEFGNDKFN